MVWYGMVWYGMVWYGMVWYGMVWYGIAWHGMTWYGMVWYAPRWRELPYQRRVLVKGYVAPIFSAPPPTLWNSIPLSSETDSDIRESV